MGAPANGIDHRVRSLHAAASALQVVAVVCSAGGFFAGVAMASHVGSAPTTAAHIHPHLAAGIAVMLAAVLLGCLSWCVARAIALFASDVAARNGVDLGEAVPSRLPEFAQRPKRA